MLPYRPMKARTRQEWLTAVALSAAFGSARAEVLIGVSAAMTGRLSWIGEQAQRGTEMAVADINAAGGVLGQQVRLITVDDFCDPEQAVVAAEKLVETE